jgi:phage head maturation protease
MISDEEREQVELALERSAPPLAEQLAIRAQALKLARESLGLEGRARYESLEREREFLALSMRAAEGEEVEWPSDTEYRMAIVSPPSTSVVGDPEDLNTLFGFWMVFDQPAQIADPHDGLFLEVIRPSAARHAISQKRWPAYLRDHGRHPQLGRTPIGKVTLLTTMPEGAWIEAEPLNTTLVREHVVEPARAGVLGHSFAFSIPGRDAEVWRRSPTRGGLPIREVLDARISEITATAQPAYQGTTLSYRHAHEPWRLPEPPERLRTVADRLAEYDYRDRERTVEAIRRERDMADRLRVRQEIRERDSRCQ